MLVNNKLLIIFVTLAGLFLGLLYSASRDPAEYEYSATSTLSVVFGQNLGQITGSTVISNYSEIATSNLVGEYAAELLPGEGLTVEQIQRMVRVSSGNNSFVFKITARNASPRTAILVANAVAESFVAKASVITGSNTIQVLDPAESADVIIAGSMIDIRLIAPAAAFVFICAVLIVTEIANGRVRSVWQCVDDERELLALVPKVKDR